MKNTNDKGTLTQIDFAKIPAAAAAAAAAVAVAAAAMEQQQRILLSRFRTRNGYQYVMQSNLYYLLKLDKNVTFLRLRLRDVTFLSNLKNSID